MTIEITNLKGYLPVDATVVHGRPGLLWLDMSGVDLVEPFFHQTVARAKKENREQLFTEFDTLLQLEKSRDSVAPSGFIFHSSRCGSTLLSNAARAIDNTIVLSEPYAVDKLIARFITDAPTGSVKESLYSVFLRGVVHALGQRRKGSEQRLIVKFACCSFAQFERIRRIWPNVPCVFMYRDPVETIVSNLTDVPPWLLDEDRRVLASIMSVSTAEAEAMRLEELCARTIGRLYSLAHRLAHDGGLLLNYNQLSLPVISRVLNFLNLDASTGEMKKISSRSRNYSKEASGARAFVADAEAKQERASDLIRQLAEQWAMLPYRQLEEINRQSWMQQT